MRFTWQIRLSFWFCMRIRQWIYLSFLKWWCSLHPCYPSSSSHLSPLGARCIANERLMNHALVCCRKEAKGPAPGLMSSPCFPIFHLSPSILPFVVPEQALSISISIRFQFALLFVQSTFFLQCMPSYLCTVIPGCLYLWLMLPWTHVRSSLEGVSLTPDWFLSKTQWESRDIAQTPLLIAVCVR